MAMPVLSCSVGEMDDSRAISFSATNGGGFALSVQNLIVSKSANQVLGSSCEVRITEPSNTYVGGCGSAPPSEMTPCQVTALDFYDDMGNPTIEGKLICMGLKNSANPLLEVEITAPGSGPAAEMTPMNFRFANCSGLRL